MENNSTYALDAEAGDTLQASCASLPAATTMVTPYCHNEWVGEQNKLGRRVITGYQLFTMDTLTLYQPMTHMSRHGLYMHKPIGIYTGDLILTTCYTSEHGFCFF